MRIDVITAFPRILQDPLDESILKQAKKRVDLQINLIDLRDFATDKHRTIDDTPYGGGPGMILKPEPLFRALEQVFEETGDREASRVIYPTPQGKLFHQALAEELAQHPHLVFICGHYKAVDQRVIDAWVTDEISVGDFVLSGGEIPTLLMIDSIVRLIPGAIGDIESAKTDSFQDGLLDCPYYTRPEEFRGLKVPEVLLSGNHQKIAEWRMQQRLERTRQRRPDLYRKYVETKQQQKES
ncbi:MAG: tRNA (guanosine(37)-N1)-methyltransferase TrmD [Calditrichaeota bacterium]|nr:MAG: tRNA (guanosine(37)-N1)-methyltransferase TrmD [Calditrichota bacterium]